MEAVAVAEQTIEEVVRSEYERERGKPMPSFNHAIIQARISQQLLNGYEDQFTVGSEMSLISTTPPTVPALSIFPESPINWMQDEVKVARIPLTVVEILSPSQTVTELTEKAKSFFATGVKSYWLVQPTFRSVVILQPNADELVFHNDLLTDPTNGISIDLKKVFR
ncbi:Uma2 family endonuclease [Spirosoma areae]